MQGAENAEITNQIGETSDQLASADLRQILLQFQKDDYLCDTILIGDNGQLKAHSVVLAASSALFKSSLKSDTKPSEHVIMLPGMEMYLLEIALHLAYTGKVVIPEKYTSDDSLRSIINVLAQIGLSIPKPYFRYIESDRTTIATDRGNEMILRKTTARKRCAKQQRSKVDKVLFVSMPPSQSKNVSTVGRSLLEQYHCGRCGEKFSTVCALSSHISAQHEFPKVAVNVETAEAALKHRLGCGVLENKPFSRSLTAFNDGVPELDTESVCMQYTCDKLWRAADMPQCLFETSLSPEASSSELSSWRTVGSPQQPAAERANHSRAVYLCELCGLVFDGSQKLNSHKVVHVGERNPFYCAECDRQFHYMHSLRRHVLIEHRGELPNLCQYCGKGYRSWHGLRDHVLSLHHANFFTSDGGFPVDCGDPRIVPYCCRVCGKTFATRKRLATHIRREEHRPVTSGRRSSVVDDDPVPKESVASKVGSSVAGATVPVTVETLAGYECATCGRRYTTRAGRNAHVKMKHGVCERPYKCTVCGRRYTTPSSLRYHSISHSADRPHRCPKCSRQFKTHMALSRHSVQHSGYRPHVCSTCGKSFAFLGQLNGHSKQVHGGALLKAMRPEAVLVAAYSTTNDTKGPSIIVMSAD